MGKNIVEFPARRLQDGHNAAPDAIHAVEQHLLGALLAKPSLTEELPAGFGPHHFLDPDHRAVFDAIKSASDTEATFIIPLVRAALPHLEITDDVGMPSSYVVSLMEAMIDTLPGMAKPYAEAVMDAADRRELLAVAEGIKRETGPMAAVPAVPSAVIAKAMLAFERIMTRQAKWRPAITIADAARQAIVAGEIAAKGGGLSGVATGLRCIDRRIGGLEPGTVTVLAARPGVGKTALATLIALNVASNGIPTEYISLEMPAKQMGRRAIALAGAISLGDIKRGNFVHSTQGYSEAVRGTKTLDGLPLLIEDEANLQVAAIKLRAKAAARRMNGLGLLVIDHLHNMGRPDSSGRHGDTQAIGEMAQGVKGIAKDLDIPVLLVAQLNRGVEGREDKRPSLADLKQSGAIEEYADTVMFIYRKAYYTETREEMPKPRRRGDFADVIPTHLTGPNDQAEILFEKMRDGERGVEYLRYDAPRARFHEEGQA